MPGLGGFGVGHVRHQIRAGGEEVRMHLCIQVGHALKSVRPAFTAEKLYPVVVHISDVKIIMTHVALL